MDDNVSIDWATTADRDELADVMYDAVRNGRSLYTEAERTQWVSEPRRGAAWQARLDRKAIAIARIGAGIAGFMSLDGDGYIDLAYVRPTAQGRGLFRRLFDRIEALGAARGEPLLRVHASLMAETAFAAVGFEVTERQIVRLGGETLRRAEMVKRAVDRASAMAAG